MQLTCTASGTLIFNTLAWWHSQHAVFVAEQNRSGAQTPDWKGLYQIPGQLQAPGTRNAQETKSCLTYGCTSGILVQELKDLLDMQGFRFISKYRETRGNAKQAHMSTSPQSQQTHCMETRPVLHTNLGVAGCMSQARALAGEALPALWCLPLRSQLDNKAGR